jgi:hypothetical protein
MYLPTLLASSLVLALTRLWTLNPVCRQERRRLTHSGLRSSLRTRSARTSRAKIDPVAKCLDGRDDSGRKLAPGQGFEVTDQGPEGQAAKIPQEPAFVLEEDTKHLGDGEDDLAVGDMQEEFLRHPLAPLLKPLGVTGGAEPAGAAGEHQEALLATVGTADAGKPAAGVAVIEASLRGAKRRGNLMPFARHSEITTAFQAS